MTRVDSADQLGAGNFVLVSNGSGMSVQYQGTGYNMETLVWNSTTGTWSNTGTGWYKSGDGGKTDTSFLNNDSVIFTAAEGVKTIALTGNIIAGTVTFQDGTNYTLNMGAGDSLQAEALSLGSQATLTLGDAAITGGTFTLGNNAGLLVSEGKTAAIASSITFGTGNTFTLGNNASLTLGDATHLMESFSSTVMGGTNSSLSVWLGNTDGSVTLSPGSTLKDITVYGNYAANTASQPAADTLNGCLLYTSPSPRD